MTRTPRRLLFDIAALGLTLTVLIALLDYAGLFWRLEFFAYDLRARVCHSHEQPPTNQLIQIDIDDGSLDEIGRWPWPRSEMAEIIDELRLTGPKVVDLDVFFSEPELPRPEQQIDDSWQMVDHDQLLADAIRRCGNVLVPVHVSLEPAQPVPEMREVMITSLGRDLEQSDEQLVSSVRALGVDAPDLAEQVTREYPLAIKEAMFGRINDALGIDPNAQPFTAEELRTVLLPHSTATRVRTPADRVLERTLPNVLSMRALERLTRLKADGLPPLLTSKEDDVTIPALINAAAYCGCVDYLPLSDGVVRYVPLWILHRDRLLPQAGFALACAYLGVDIHSVRIEPEQVVIPRPGNQDIVIPVHTVQSAARGELGLFMDIPWIGSGDWQTIFDFPSHQLARQHLPVTRIWDICELGRQIKRNNFGALTDIELVLAKNDQETLAAIKAKHLAYDDTVAWNAAMALAYNAVSTMTKQYYSSQLDLNGSLDLNSYSGDEREYVAALRNLLLRPRRNTELAAERDRLRQALAQQLRDKAVLIGWVASGQADLYTTPLHVACPGVAIHGTIFNGIVTGDLWQTMPQWVTTVITLGLGVLAAAAVTWLTPLKAVITNTLLGAGYLAINGMVLFDRHHVIVGVAGPLCTVISVTVACSLVKYFWVSVETTWITNQFRSHVDPSLVNYMMEHPEEAGFEGEERELTVVFTDLTDFAALSETLKRKTVPLLNEYLSLMEPIIRANHGLVNKFLGDGIMFFFGAPAPYPGNKKGHAEAAVKTVFEMHAAMVEFNEKLKAKNLMPLKMRAGICSGEMVVGNAGTPNRSDYTVLGHRVNFASRLEGANKATGTLTLLSERTAELIEDAYLVRKIGRLQVVGILEASMSYEPLAPLGQATDENRQLVKLTDSVVNAYVKAKFPLCLEAVDELERNFGSLQEKLCELYRRSCREHIQHPPPIFSGQIKLEHK